MISKGKMRIVLRRRRKFLGYPFKFWAIPDPSEPVSGKQGGSDERGGSDEVISPDWATHLRFSVRNISSDKTVISV